MILAGTARHKGFLLAIAGYGIERLSNISALSIGSDSIFFRVFLQFIMSVCKSIGDVKPCAEICDKKSNDHKTDN